MRTPRPDRVSKAYIQALYDWQLNFLATITASEETNKKAREAWPFDGVHYKRKKDAEKTGV